MFDFIVENYNNLPDATIFCRACFLWPKDTGRPKYDEKGNRLSNGNCSEEYFLKVCNNTTFTSLDDFASETWRFDGVVNKIGPDNSYMEKNSDWYFTLAPYKYYNNINTFLNDFYVNMPYQEYFRFSPGGNYIIPKDKILKYNIDFYQKIKEILSWDIIISEAHMIERAIYTIFNTEHEVKEQYKIK